MNLRAWMFLNKEGFRNLGAKLFLTIASIATVACTVFIYLVMISFMGNLTYVLDQVESKVGIQVFFDEDLSDDQIKEIAESNFKSGKIKEMKFTSSAEAWEKVKETYFDNDESLIEAFEGENPLKSSASYSIYLYDIEDEIDVINKISSVKGVRKVNYFQDIISALIDMKNFVNIIACSVIAILSIISIILISNTISITAEIRKEENEIKKLIGATNFMVRGPFILEAVIIAFIGTTISIVIVSLSYTKVINYLIPPDSLIQTSVNLLSIYNILPFMLISSYSATIGLSIIVAYLSIRTTVRV